MTPEELQVYFDTSPAVHLFRATSAPHVIAFLFARFKKARRLDIPHADLLSALAAYQDGLREAGVTALLDRPEEYLREWSTEKHWLQRTLNTEYNEPIYQLTSSTEQVIEFLERSLQKDMAFVGTDSRLRLVMRLLEELVVCASDDPETRLAHLRSQLAEIQDQIDDIVARGSVAALEPRSIREQFDLAIRLLKQLQGDFRAVEDRFKEITRQIQQRQAEGADTRGGILSHALGAEDQLKQQDQGLSFFEFLRFIQSPRQQDRLQSIIKELLELRELSEQSEGRDTIRHMVPSLLDEAAKVFHTTRRLSSSLKRLVDTRTQEERRRLADVLRDMRVFATNLSDQPPDQIGAEVDTNIEICAPLSRTNWAPPPRFEQINLVEQVVDEDLRREAFRAFLHLRPIDWVGMRRNISVQVGEHGTQTLAELLAKTPVEGLVDVIAYLQIACEDDHFVNCEATEVILLTTKDTNGVPLAVTVPHIRFIAKGKANA